MLSKATCKVTKAESNKEAGFEIRRIGNQGQGIGENRQEPGGKAAGSS